MQQFCQKENSPSPQCLSCTNYGRITCPLFAAGESTFRWATSHVKPAAKSEVKSNLDFYLEENILQLEASH
ncbi:MAG: hypothetical protein AAF621_06445 [Pseudomonadota bacterium]